MTYQSSAAIGSSARPKRFGTKRRPGVISRSSPRRKERPEISSRLHGCERGIAGKCGRTELRRNVRDPRDRGVGIPRQCAGARRRHAQVARAKPLAFERIEQRAGSRILVVAEQRLSVRKLESRVVRTAAHELCVKGRCLPKIAGLDAPGGRRLAKPRGQSRSIARPRRMPNEFERPGDDVVCRVVVVEQLETVISRCVIRGASPVHFA